MAFKPPAQISPVLVSSRTKTDLLGTTLHRRSTGELAFRPTTGEWDKLKRDIRNTYKLASPSTGAVSVCSSWIARNSHIVASFGAKEIVDRVMKYCTEAGLDEVPRNYVENAATSAEQTWRSLVLGHSFPITTDSTSASD